MSNGWAEAYAYARRQTWDTGWRHRVESTRLPNSGAWVYVAYATNYRFPISPRWRQKQAGLSRPVPESSTPRSFAREHFAREDFDRAVAGQPRCAAQSHLGGSKVCLPDRWTAKRCAAFLRRSGQRYAQAYRCDLPSPTGDKHWHLSTSKRR